MMRKEIKICLPVYKIIYSICFIVLLAMVRGISYSAEAGPAIEGPAAILAFVFCADTYVQEITSRRSQVLCLCPVKLRVNSLYARIVIQEAYLVMLCIAGYGLFYLFQRPVRLSMEVKEGYLFLLYLAAVFVTVVFWGVLSVTISCLCRNLWASAALCLVLWASAYSAAAERILGKWNLFSYTSMGVDESIDWICGKAVGIFLIVIMTWMLAVIIRKRG